MRREYRHWTSDEDAKLHELWTARASAGAIAKRLTRSKASIFQRVHNLRKAGFDFPHRNDRGWVTRRGMAKKSEAA